MKVGLLGWDHGELDLDVPAYLETGRSRGHDLSVFTLEEITYVARRSGGFDLRLAGEPAQSFDAILSRAKLYGDDWQDRVERLTLLSQVPGVRLFDPADAWVRGYSKLLCTERLAAAGLPVAPTRSVTSVEDVEEALVQWGDVVVKPSFQFSGTDVERITALPDEEEVVRDLLSRYVTLACMPHYPTEHGEYRLNVAGDTSCVTTFKLPPLGIWRCKTLEGATFERVEAPPELAEMAFRAARAMGLSLAGVDALPTPEGYVILEANPVPGMLNMLGDEARQDTLDGLYDWVERQTACPHG